ACPSGLLMPTPATCFWWDGLANRPTKRKPLAGTCTALWNLWSRGVDQPPTPRYSPCPSSPLPCSSQGLSPFLKGPRMRHSLLLGIGVIVLLVGGLAAGLALLVRHEPGFYSRSAVKSGPVRKQHSRDFKMEFSNLLNGAFNSNDWQVTFTEVQLNSYFEEDFLTSGLAEKLLPESITAPRVAVETDKLRLAFRYGVPPWSTIISIDLRVWLARKEPNVIALELQGLHAGSLPINAQSLLEQ